MEIDTHIEAVRREGERLAAAASAAGLDDPIPWCPGWVTRDLLRHLSEIHLWAAGHVKERQDPSFGGELAGLTEVWGDLAAFWPDDDQLVSWYLDTNANLVRTLQEAPADVDAWTFLPAPTPLAMWARRQAHETAIHRFDAESATGSVTGFDPAFASDGIDEILTAMAPRARELPLESDVTMAVNPTDVPERWLVTLGPNGIDTVRTDGPADLALTGLASDLYLAVWNRGDDTAIKATGDSAVLDVWRDRHKSRWPRTRDEDDAKAQQAGR